MTMSGSGRGPARTRWRVCGGSLVLAMSTPKYRLRRIREISQHDLSDPNTLFNLQLATRAWSTLRALRDI